MYSILIEKGTNTFGYALDETSGEKFSGPLADTKAKFMELLNKYPISKLTVVHNTTVANDMTITDVE